MDAACQVSLSITISWSLLKLMSIESVMLSNHFILCHALLLPPSIFPSIRGFYNESALRIRWPKGCGVSASTSVLPMNTQDWSPLGWTSWISLRSKGLSRVFSNTTIQNINSSVLSIPYSPTSSVGKESACNAGDLGLISGLGRSHWEGKDYPLQYSGLENSMNCIVQLCKKLDTPECISLSLSHIHTWLLEKP